MTELKRTERFAVEAVARRFSAIWQESKDPPDANMTVAGRRIAVDIAVVAQRRLGRNRLAKLRLRDDVVARRVLRDLESALRKHVPTGKTVILTLGAPIKEPKRLVVALTEMLLTCLAGGIEDVKGKKTILGNRVQFGILGDNLQWNSKVIGFVFSGDLKLGVLVDAIRLLHDEISAKMKKNLPAEFSGDRWLVLVSDHWIADIKTYRRIYSQLSTVSGFKKILMVRESGQVEALAEA
jgi:hypothetical protein